MITEPVVGEEPTGTKPGTVFLLQRTPLTNTTALYANGLRLQRVTAGPMAQGQFTLAESSGTIVTGWTLDAFEVLLADYDTMGFEATAANILALALDLGLGQGDFAQMADFLDDVFIDLASRGWICALLALSAAKAQATYALPADAVELLAAFHDDAELSPAMARDLDAVASGDWRLRQGRPSSVVREDEDDRTIRLFPIPDLASKAPGTNALGDGFPVGAVHLLYLAKVTTLPEWLALPAALLVNAREFARESDHRDLTFATACQQIADALLGLVS